MRALIIGGGGIGEGIASRLLYNQWIVRITSHGECDVTDATAVEAEIRNCSTNWDLVVCTAGVESSALETLMTNLYGSLNVARSCAAHEIPCILIGSVAGLYGKPGHLAYSASKAGVISIVQSLGFDHSIWCISPGRVDTPMREKHYPQDTPGSRLTPGNVADVVDMILAGVYESGSNVIIRKQGADPMSTITIEKEVNPWKELLRVGLPVEI